MALDKEEPFQVALEFRPLIPFAFYLSGQAIQVVDLGVEVVEKVQGKGLLHHGQGGRAELIPAMMAQDQMLEPVTQVFRKPGDPIDFFLDHLYPQNHVPHQTAPIRVFKGEGVEAEFFQLADVVEKRPGHEQGAVQARVEGADAVRQPGHTQGVLQQPAHIGVVHRLGGWRFFKRLHESPFPEQG